MKRLLVLLGVCLMSPVALFAQDAPGAQVFGGFSAFTFRTAGLNERFMPIGWQAAIEARVSNRIGLVGDFGGHYKTLGGTRLHFYEYMGGVRFHAPVSTVEIFGHALAGAGTGGGGGSSSTAFAMGYGGGVDWRVNDAWSVRLVQADWIPTRTEGVWRTNQVRFGFGLVWNR